MNDIINDLLHYFHIFIQFLVFTPILTNNKMFLLFYFYLTTFIIFGWIIFNNNCWLTIIQKKLDPDMENNHRNSLYFIQNVLKVNISKLTFKYLFYFNKYV